MTCSEPARSTLRRLRPVAALALVGLTSAGCGANAASGSATATSTGTPATGATAKLTAQEKAVKFSECMRAHGVPHFPDPDPKGDYNFGVDVTKEVFTKAVNACKALEPPGALSAKRTPK